MLQQHQQLLQQALASKDPKAIALAYQLATTLQQPYYAFTPRPDKPEQLDQQASFFHDRFPGIACVIAGNGAGKTWCASAKISHFLRTTPPPEPNTPFWIASTKMADVASACWRQNLSQFITPDQIKDIVWFSEKDAQPRTIVLKPHANGNNYVIDLKSYDEGREKWQNRNLIGFWMDEQCPFELLMEAWARTRKWSIPGSKIYTLTPLEPDQKLESIFHEPPDSWRFYRMNTRIAADHGHVTREYIQQISENELPELVETRLTGAFAHYEGAVYKNFDANVHVIDPIELPHNWLRIRGLDLGWNHYTACVWAAKDLEGHYYIYREYYAAQTSIEDHVKNINEGWDDLLVKGKCYADPAAAQILHEFALRGLHTVSAQKDVMAGIACVQSLLRPGQDGKPKLFFFKSCPLSIAQMRGYVYDPKTGKPKKETSTYLHDGADAIRYLCYSHKMDTVPLNYKPMKPQEKQRNFNF